MENRKIRTTAEKLYILFALLVAIIGIVAITSYGGKAVVKASQVPTVYMTHGDQDTCIKAKNAEGMHISCSEAMKGVYHTEWVAPKELMMGLR